MDPDQTWRFTPADMERTPSRWHPTSPLAWPSEAYHRALGVSFLTRVAISMTISQTVIATASQYLHRFYMRQAIQHHPPKVVGVGALWLSCKVEEQGKRLEHMINGYWQLDMADKTGKQPFEIRVDTTSPDYQKLRKHILYIEDVLLRVLCFDLEIGHPYLPLIRTVRLLHPWPRLCARPHSRSRSRSRSPASPPATTHSSPHPPGPAPSPAETRERTKHLVNAGWGFLNDSLHTVVGLLQSPETVAAAAYWLALRSVNREPEDQVRPLVNASGGRGVEDHLWWQDRPGQTDGMEMVKGKKMPWWQAFGATSLQDVNEAVDLMLDFYSTSQSAYLRGRAEQLRRPALCPPAAPPLPSGPTPSASNGNGAVAADAAPLPAPASSLASPARPAGSPATLHKRSRSPDRASPLLRRRPGPSPPPLQPKRPRRSSAAAAGLGVEEAGERSGAPPGAGKGERERRGTAGRPRGAGGNAGAEVREAGALGFVADGPDPLRS